MRGSTVCTKANEESRYPSFSLVKADILHISESGVESAIRRSHSDWLCSTLQ